MTDDTRYVPDEDWRTVVASIPLVAVDLVVIHDGAVILGKRMNEPAKGEWFVPGGRVRKNETLEEAVHRVAHDELDCDVRIERQLGVYEHFYDTSEFDGIGKHYVPIGYLVHPDGPVDLQSDAQHEQLSEFTPPIDIDLHPYVETYLHDAAFL